MTQPPYPPQQPYPPPGPWPPASPRKPFWRTAPGVLVIVGGAVAVICVLACVGASLLPDSTPKGATSPAFKVEVISCTFSPPGDSVQTATVGLMVMNVSSSARAATVSVEYRDAEGTRVDTDTARFDSIQPGDTVRKDEVTILDAAVVGQGTCAVTKVR